MRHLITLAGIALFVAGCEGRPATTAPAQAGAGGASAAPVRRASMPPIDANNIVSVASGSKDHTTLVTALKAADYVTSVANPGPLTVFAPTNAAFDKLPKGTVEELVKPAKVDDLKGILKHHVVPSTYEAKDLKDGMVLGMANGAKTTLHVKDGKVTINDAAVVGSIRCSNGIIHVIDTVLLPPAK